MRIVRKIAVYVFFCTALFACGREQKQDAELQWESVLAGHARLTAQAYDEAIAKIQSTIPRVDRRVRDLLIVGNTDTDFQWQGMNQDYLGFYRVHASDWSTNCKVSEIHFIRRECSADKIESAYETCRQAQQRISDALEFSAYWWNDGEKDKALRFIGHTLHTLQDGFAPAHTRRSADDGFRTLLDVCTYKYEKPGICHHKHLLSEKLDFISEDGKLRPEAVAAIAATRSYLEIVLPTFLSGEFVSHVRVRREIDTFLNVFDSNVPGSGAFRCESLKGK